MWMLEVKQLQMSSWWRWLSCQVSLNRSRKGGAARRHHEQSGSQTANGGKRRRNSDESVRFLFIQVSGNNSHDRKRLRSWLSGDHVTVVTNIRSNIWTFSAVSWHVRQVGCVRSYLTERFIREILKIPAAFGPSPGFKVNGLFSVRSYLCLCFPLRMRPSDEPGVLNTSTRCFTRLWHVSVGLIKRPFSDGSAPSCSLFLWQ